MPPAGKPVVGHRTDFPWHVTGDGPRRAIRPGRISQGPVSHVANWNGLGSEHVSVPSPPCRESEPRNPKGVVPTRVQDGVVARPADQDVVATVTDDQVVAAQAAEGVVATLAADGFVQAARDRAAAITTGNSGLRT